MLQLPQLPYAYDALEPYVDAATMEIHYTRHHQAYTTNFNLAIARYPQLENRSVVELLSDLSSIPADVQATIRNNGGGYYNHTLFWEMMTPDSTLAPVGDLAQAIDREFGGFDAFKAEFSAAALTVFGSGWAWLAVDQDKKLHVVQTFQQDTVIMQNLQPVLGLDVWEHAYYLKYQNKRPDYIAAWWNVVNWNRAEELYQSALAGKKVAV